MKIRDVIELLNKANSELIRIDDILGKYVTDKDCVVLKPLVVGTVYLDLLPVLKYFYKQGVDIAQYGEDLYSEAFEYEHLDILRWLVDNKIPTGDNTHFIRLAVIKNNLRMVEIVGGIGLSISQINSGVYYAAGNGSIEIVKHLLSLSETKLSDLPAPVLYNAIMADDLDMVRYLIKEDVGVIESSRVRNWVILNNSDPIAGYLNGFI